MSDDGNSRLDAHEAAELEELLEFLKQDRGFDFTGYKRTTIGRRVATRLAAMGVDSFGQYLDFLQTNPEEFGSLFDALLINVTSFFRDPQAWEFLAAEVLPKLLADRPAGEPIRVWSAGCASGEEAFSLAILLAEQLGAEAMRDRVKIYGTDLDESALTLARHALYPGKALAGLSEEMVARYFEPFGSQFAFRKDLRRTVIFGRHDLVQAAPISHLHLLVCRNTLMYLDAETQARVLNRLHFALEDGGVLFLGKAEMLLGHGDLFRPIDLKRRIFAKVAKDTLRERLAVISDGGGHVPAEYPVDYRRIREAAADSAAMPQIVVHRGGTLALANTAARNVFGLSQNDVGRPFQDLLISYQPAELRSAVDGVANDRRPILIEGVCWPDGAVESKTFDVHVVPLFDHAGAALGVSISFVDISLTRRLQDELEASHRNLETAYEELQSTNEELETTNEELQSTVEELETTNEELQSTNEELETMNAELHSTNEELQTINDELRLRSGEIDELNGVLESLVSAQRGGLVVIDRDLRVTMWNRGSAELWGLRADEVPGQHFLNLDIGLPTDALRPAIRNVLTGSAPGQEEIVQATNRKGREFRCTVTLEPLLSREGDIRGVILMMRDGAG